MSIDDPNAPREEKPSRLEEHSARESLSCAAELIVDIEAKAFSILPVVTQSSRTLDAPACSIEAWESYIHVMRRWGVCWEGLGASMTMCHTPPRNIFVDESCPEPLTIKVEKQTLYYRRHPNLLGRPNHHVYGDVHSEERLKPYQAFLLTVCLLWVVLSTIRYFVKWCQKQFRVPPGHKRLVWQCSCGKELFGDYKAKDKKRLEQFEWELQRLDQPRRLSFVLPHIARHSTSRWSESTVLTQASSTRSPWNSSMSSTEKSSKHGPLPVSSSVPQSATPGLESTLHNSPVRESASQLREPLRFFELCVSTNALSITLAELRLNTTVETTIDTDGLLFAAINKEYFRVRKLRHFAFLYKPIDIQFIRFSIYAGGRVGIYEKPMSLPSENEVTTGNYHYYECPLDPLPPIDHRTFFHYFWNYGNHMNSQSTLFLDRLPKKMNTSMHVQGQPDQLNLGWGVHIIEGPNKKMISLCIFAIVVVSFIASLTYSVVIHSQESGFGIGQWIVAVGTVGLSAIYFQLSE